MSVDYKAFRVDKKGQLALVAMSNPERGNAMGPDFWAESPQLFGALGEDDEVRAIVVYGEGKAFTYGLDLMATGAELGDLFSGRSLAAQRTRLLAQIVSMQKAFSSIAECRKPVVAAIHGWCIGGGIEMISACDVRVCSRDAKFSLREARMAIVADLGGLQRLPTLVGEGHARELALTGRDIDADRALRIGLVNDVYETREATIEAAVALAQSMADNPPLVVQGVKRVLNYSQGKSIQDGLDFVAAWNSAFLQSEDFGEAMSAFMEKRKPVFRGE